MSEKPPLPPNSGDSPPTVGDILAAEQREKLQKIRAAAAQRAEKQSTDASTHEETAQAISNPNSFQKTTPRDAGDSFDPRSAMRAFEDAYFDTATALRAQGIQPADIPQKWEPVWRNYEAMRKDLRAYARTSDAEQADIAKRMSGLLEEMRAAKENVLREALQQKNAPEASGPTPPAQEAAPKTASLEQGEIPPDVDPDFRLLSPEVRARADALREQLLPAHPSTTANNAPRAAATFAPDSPPKEKQVNSENTTERMRELRERLTDLEARVRSGSGMKGDNANIEQKILGLEDEIRIAERTPVAEFGTPAESRQKLRNLLGEFEKVQQAGLHSMESDYSDSSFEDDVPSTTKAVTSVPASIAGNAPSAIEHSAGLDHPSKKGETPMNREHRAHALASAAGVEAERQALKDAESKLIEREKDHYRHGILSRGLHNAFTTSRGRRAQLEDQMNEAALRYDAKLQELLAKRLDDKFAQTGDVRYRSGSAERAQLEARYRRSVAARDVVVRGERLRADAKQEVFATRSRNMFEKGALHSLRYLGEKNKVLEAKLGKNGARVVRVFLSAGAGAGTAALFGPGMAALGLSAVGFRVARGLVGTFGGSIVGGVAGKVYEKTSGKVASAQMRKQHEQRALSIDDMAAGRRTYRAGNTESIERKRRLVEAIAAAVSGAGFSLGTAYAVANPEIAHSLSAALHTANVDFDAIEKTAVHAGHAAEHTLSSAIVAPAHVAPVPPVFESNIAREVANSAHRQGFGAASHAPLPGPIHPETATKAFMAGQDATTGPSYHAPAAPHYGGEATTGPTAHPQGFSGEATSGPELHTQFPQVPTVLAQTGLGYEAMAKQLTEQMHGMHLDPSQFPPGSDAARLLAATPHDINRIVQQIATERGYLKLGSGSVLVRPGDTLTVGPGGSLHFFDPKMATHAPYVVNAPNAAPTTPLSSHAEMSQPVNHAPTHEAVTPPRHAQPLPMPPPRPPVPGVERAFPLPPKPPPMPPAERLPIPPTPPPHEAAMRAPIPAGAEHAPSTPGVGQERVTTAQLNDWSLSRARLGLDTPPVTPPSPHEIAAAVAQHARGTAGAEQAVPLPAPIEHLHAFVNAHGLTIDPTHGEVFQTADGKVAAYGNSFDARFNAAQDYAFKHPGTAVWVQSEQPYLTPDSVTGKMVAKPWVFKLQVNPVTHTLDPVSPAQPLSNAQIGSLQPETFTQELH